MGFEWATEIPEDCVCRWLNKSDEGGWDRISKAPDCPVHDPVKPWPIEQCRSPKCQRDIIWALTDRLKPMPVLAEPQPSGNVVLSWSGRDVRAKVLRKNQARPFGKPLYVNHFADCPDAERFRIKQKAGKR